GSRGRRPGEGRLVTTPTAAEDLTPEPTVLERILDAIERWGNKMPHPAILFAGLCVGVIVLSQILFWFNVRATFEVVEPPPVPTEETYFGGSVEPTDVGPTIPVPPEGYKLTTEPTKVKGLLTGQGVTSPFPPSLLT